MATDTPQAARTQAIRAVLKDHSKVVWSNRLDARMQAMGVSVTVLAEGAGTTYQTLWKLLRGELYPKEYLRIAIALALGAEVEQLFPMPTREALVKAAEAAEAAAAVKAAA